MTGTKGRILRNLMWRVVLKTSVKSWFHPACVSLVTGIIGCFLISLTNPDWHKSAPSLPALKRINWLVLDMQCCQLRSSLESKLQSSLESKTLLAGSRAWRYSGVTDLLSDCGAPQVAVWRFSIENFLVLTFSRMPFLISYAYY